MVTPKPGSGNGTAGCQVVHACTGAHTPTPHGTSAALWSRDRTRQGTWPERERSPAQIPIVLALCLSLPTCGWAIPAQPLPRGTDMPPALPIITVPLKHRQWLCLGVEHRHPTLPSSRMLPSSFGLTGLGVGVRAAPVSTSILLRAAPSRTRAMVAPRPGPPCHLRDGAAPLSATPNSPIRTCPFRLLTAGEL